MHKSGRGNLKIKADGKNLFASKKIDIIIFAYIAIMGVDNNEGHDEDNSNDFR